MLNEFIITIISKKNQKIINTIIYSDNVNDIEVLIEFIGTF